ncbi:cell wall integrity and stress response component 2-like [Xenopus laevis]|uniref:Cell wall integrity and stress response component 2-like n=1 Tax=Xenopus laevis TaxID=8355 RepID=A0A8J1LYT9_XENLA|nr:cell wall integrity and stress response component 2-like [Xenopus laevis]
MSISYGTQTESETEPTVISTSVAETSISYETSTVLSTSETTSEAMMETTTTTSVPAEQTTEEDYPSTMMAPSETEDTTMETIKSEDEFKDSKEIILKEYERVKYLEIRSTLLICAIILVAFFILLIIIICATRRGDLDEARAIEEGRILKKNKNKPAAPN